MRDGTGATNLGWMILNTNGDVVCASPGVDQLLAGGSGACSREFPITIADARFKLVIIYRDATARLEAELQEAREAVRELEAVLEASFDGIWLIDGSGKVLRVNRAYERFTGIPVCDLVGRNVDELVQEGYLEDSVTSRVIASKQPVTILNRVRGNKTTLSTGTPVFDEDGNVWRVVINARDISELVNLKLQLEEERNRSLRYRQELTGIRRHQLGPLVWRSEAMRRVVELVSRVAAVDSTVLITGDSGTGKELVATLVHQLSPRNAGPFIRINCGAIPEQLLESELFGYEGGAFTGALRDGKIGLFQLANRGTLFLDEIAEMPLGLQAKLLRVLQTREITRVGGTRPIPLDIRVVAASNRDLQRAVALGQFRKDLYYRLNVVPIHLPRLAERPDDILPLLEHFLDHFNAKYGFSKYFSQEACRCLMDYDWPGNVRELENVVERLVVTTETDEITVHHVLTALRRSERVLSHGVDLRAQVADFERTVITEALRRAGSIRKAARSLGMDFSTLARKVRRLGICFTSLSSEEESEVYESARV